MISAIRFAKASISRSSRRDAGRDGRTPRARTPVSLPPEVIGDASSG